jgi:transcriptional regulator with XRE-family HTH domain
MQALVGANIKIARIRVGLSQRQVCMSTGISTVYLSQAEKGMWNMTLDHIARIAEATGVAPHELLDPEFINKGG